MVKHGNIQLILEWLFVAVKYSNTDSLFNAIHKSEKVDETSISKFNYKINKSQNLMVYVNMISVQKLIYYK